MTVAYSIFKGFFDSGATRVGDVIEKASKGNLDDTINISSKGTDTSTVDNMDIPIEDNVDVPIETVDNVDVPIETVDVEKEAEALLDTTAPVNRERQSDVSFDGRNYNLINVTDSDELVRIIDYVGSQNDNFINARGGGPKSHSETIAKSRASSLAELEKIIGYKLGDGVTDQRIFGARQLLQESADNLKTMANKIAAGDADDAFKLKFRQAISSHVAIQQSTAGMAADAGRALNAFRIPVGAGTSSESSIYRSQLQQTLEKFGGDSATKQLAEVILNAEDLEQITKTLHKAHFAKSSDIILEIWINGLLSSPATHMVNTISNQVVAILAIPERFVSATFSKLLRTKDGIQYQEAMGQIYGLWYGMRDGFVLAGRALKTGEPTDPAMKYEARRYNAFHSENFDHLLGSKINIKEGSGVAKGIDFMGDWVVRLPTRFLAAEDEYFKAVGYRMELNALAYRTAKAEGHKGADLANRIRELIENPTEEIHLGASNMARYQTFTNDLGDNGKAVQKMINNFPPFKFIAPFVRTPVNIVKYVSHRTPFNKKMWEDVAAGGVKRDVALARMSLGSLTLGMMYSYALEGKITGRGPQDKKTRDALRLTGWQPYSVYHDGKYYAYNRLDPVGMFLGLAADTAEIMHYADNADSSEVALASIMAVAKNLENKTYLEGVSRFVQAFEDPDRYMESYLGNLVSSLKPYTSLVGQVERTLDPEVSAVYSIMDRIYSQTPSLSSELPPRRNIWGDAIVLQGGLGWDFVSPVYMSYDTNDAVADELVALEVGVSMPSKKLGQGKFAVELTPQQYDRLVVIAGKEVTKTRGGNKLNMHDFLEYMINSEMYSKWEGTGPDSKKAIYLKDMMNEFKGKALIQLKKEFPDLVTQLKKAEEKRKKAYLGK